MKEIDLVFELCQIRDAVDSLPQCGVADARPYIVKKTQTLIDRVIKDGKRKD